MDKKLEFIEVAPHDLQLRLGSSVFERAFNSACSWGAHKVSLQ